MKVGKWKLLSEKTRFKNPWWSVAERKFITPNGKRVKWFVVKKPNAVCVFCLTKEKKVVAIRYFRPGVQKMVFDLPTGFVNKGETPLQAAKRELREETGFTAKKIIPLGAYAGNAAGDTLFLHCYLAVGGENSESQHLDHSEEIEVHLLTLKQLVEKIRSRQLLDTTRAGVVLLALQKLGKVKFKF